MYDLDNKLDWKAEKELDSLFAIVFHLLKSADNIVLKVLYVLTEQWFRVLEKELGTIYRQLLPHQQGTHDVGYNDDVVNSRNEELLVSSGKCVRDCSYFKQHAMCARARACGCVCACACHCVCTCLRTCVRVFVHQTLIQVYFSSALLCVSLSNIFLALEEK